MQAGGLIAPLVHTTVLQSLAESDPVGEVVLAGQTVQVVDRSEERRVGKEC